MLLQKRKTFTLIEMLIVIVIIGILAAALVPRLQSVQGRARDTKRKTDLRTIFNALEIYVLDNSDYPSDRTPGNPWKWRYSTDTSPWMPELTGIISSVPTDPRNVNPLNGYLRQTGAYYHMYRGLTTGGIDAYNLMTKLENPIDPDRCESKSYKYLNSSSFLYLNATCPSYGGGNLLYYYDIVQLRNGQH